jgi:hypothetical protein
MGLAISQRALLNYSYVINENTHRLVEIINSDFELLKVPFIHQSYAEKANCYGNVERKVLRNKGTIQYGWAIFHNAFIVEAEHHAVWQNDKGELFDITPRNSQFTSLPFIPDDRIIYSGHPIDNIRLNLTNNPIVDDFILVVEVTERIKASGTRTGDFKIRLNDHLIRLYDWYSNIASELLELFATGKNENHECYCGSKRTYQNCHRKEIKRQIEHDLRNIPGKLIRLPLAGTADQNPIKNK